MQKCEQQWHLANWRIFSNPNFNIIKSGWFGLIFGNFTPKKTDLYTTIVWILARLSRVFAQTGSPIRLYVAGVRYFRSSRDQAPSRFPEDMDWTAILGKLVQYLIIIDMIRNYCHYSWNQITYFSFFLNLFGLWKDRELLWKSSNPRLILSQEPSCQLQSVAIFPPNLGAKQCLSSFFAGECLHWDFPHDIQSSPIIRNIETVPHARPKRFQALEWQVEWPCSLDVLCKVWDPKGQTMGYWMVSLGSIGHPSLTWEGVIWDRSSRTHLMMNLAHRVTGYVSSKNDWETGW